MLRSSKSSSFFRISLHTKNQLSRLPGSGLNVMIPGGGVVVVVWWWWCGGVVVFLPIIIPHQPSCFVLFCVVGWVVATNHSLKMEMLKSLKFKQMPS